MKKTLIVLLGPTGIGKTELSLQLAERLGCPILNCDSRQLFRDLQIGTAAPTPAEQARVQHYFVGTLGLDEYYSAAQYEAEALTLLDELFKTYDKVILSGGSMLYIDAVCKGIDDIPTIDDATRHLMKERLEKEGLEKLCEELRQLDPAYYELVDKHNTRRVVHALEICHMTGKTYTSFRTQKKKDRKFDILKIGLQRPREELFARINLRVEQMMKDGLLDEVMDNLSNRHLNSLNTVGYKELFEYLDNKDKPADEQRALQMKGHIATLQDAIERIKKNTRVYAKKQMTWFAKDTDIRWFHPNDKEAIFKYIEQ
ncbi:MAG: tRNA (adenosine(37)-N6)-dimethylallyltransferase MiaA [Bacteroidaceae bacterium]|nr:tRNA (adenosine(37)-N6)-dimethylallyltransferase MiaA [Bacteroidaceae bacterium]